MNYKMKYITSMAVMAIFILGSFAVFCDDDNSNADASYTYYYVVGDVTYEGGSTPGEVTLETIDAIGASVPAGKEFVGWSDGSNIHNADTQMTITTNTIFTASFANIVYTITFMYDNVAMPSSYGYYDAVTVPTVTAPEGYEFTGWYDGTTVISAIPAVTEDSTYVAMYSVIVTPVVGPTYYNVTFLGVDGTTVIATETVLKGEYAVEPMCSGCHYCGVQTTAIEGDTSFIAIADNAGMSTIEECVIIIAIFVMLILLVIERTKIVSWIKTRKAKK